jgi:peptidoglycan hydrolase-like protein with peptidoglycan-binding domain
MNLKLLVAALSFLAISSVARADQAIESVQQKLTEQGFYYGEINGKKDADTTAAIRRYQIRNGLPITGEIDAATKRSLGLTSKPASMPEPRSTSTPGPTPPDYRAESPRSKKSGRAPAV